MDERAQAKRIADRMLDEPYADPDGDQCVLARQFNRSQEEVERLSRWVADLQSGMYVNCVYCGHRYGPGETTPVSMADALKAHVERCPKHPMSKLRDAALEAIEAIEMFGWQSSNTDSIHSERPQRYMVAELKDALDSLRGATDSPPSAEEKP